MFSVENAKHNPSRRRLPLRLAYRSANSGSRNKHPEHCFALQILIEASRRHYACEGAGRSAGSVRRARPLESKRCVLYCGLMSPLTCRRFRARSTTDLPVPCTFDFNVAPPNISTPSRTATCRFVSNSAGRFFMPASNGTLQIDQIGWDKEARFPASRHLWREMMDHYYPNSAWLRLRRDAFDRLLRIQETARPGYLGRID